MTPRSPVAYSSSAASCSPSFFRNVGRRGFGASFECNVKVVLRHLRQVLAVALDHRPVEGGPVPASPDDGVKRQDALARERVLALPEELREGLIQVLVGSRPTSQADFQD